MGLKVGIFVDSLRLPIDEGLKVAAEIGAQCFQVYLTSGEMLAANMPAPARADFAARYRDLGLELSATCGDFHLNFSDAELMAEKEPLLVAAIEQTVDLGASNMTTHSGAVGADPDGAKAATMAAALKRLGDIAANAGVTLATETGLESGRKLREIIEAADTKGIGVNFDPANLVMNAFDHFQAACDLKELIVHTHAKDGVRDPDGTRREVPLGEGGVNFPAYTRLLGELGYDGACVVEREAGDDPVGDVTRAVAFLKAL